MSDGCITVSPPNRNFKSTAPVDGPLGLHIEPGDCWTVVDLRDLGQPMGFKNIPFDEKSQRSIYIERIFPLRSNQHPGSRFREMQRPDPDPAVPCDPINGHNNNHTPISGAKVLATEDDDDDDCGPERGSKSKPALSDTRRREW